MSAESLAKVSGGWLSRLAGPFALAVAFLGGFVCIALFGTAYGKELPGDLGDNRFNLYVLEHVFQWLRGTHGLWDPPFYYAFPKVLAFSVNHLGSVFTYAIFRLLGADTLTAFQYWYLASFVLNFWAAVYALRRFGVGSVAAAFGAFVFAYSMVILFQQSHAQLMYRFAVPLACLSLWQLNRERRLWDLLLLVFWFVWQFAMEIYTGVFLSFLLLALAFLIPVVDQKLGLIGSLRYWPVVLAQAWRLSAWRVRICVTVAMMVLLAFWAALLLPYIEVTRLYGFKRDWKEISEMLPRLASYFLNNHSLIYHFPSSWFSGLPMPWEHQLFLGGGVLMAMLLSIVKRARETVLLTQLKLNLFAILILVLVTFYVGDYSPYRLTQFVPGVSAIRAVSRIILVILWPVSVVCAVGMHSLLESRTRAPIWRILAIVIAALTFADAFWMRQPGVPKAVAVELVSRQFAKVPKAVVPDPILMLAVSPDELEWNNELDAMLLAQQLGWVTFNGYTGNVPPISRNHPYSCSVYPRRIASVLLFEKRFSEEEYLKLAKRVVPIGYQDCKAEWAERMPFYGLSSGPLPRELLDKITVKISSIKPYRYQLKVDLQISNASLLNLPAIAKDGRPFLLAARLIDDATGASLSGFDFRADLDLDLPAGATVTQTLWMPMPKASGRYRIDASGVQEYIIWLHDLGMTVARSAQVLKIENREASVLPPNE